MLKKLNALLLTAGLLLLPQPALAAGEPESALLNSDFVTYQEAQTDDLPCLSYRTHIQNRGWEGVKSSGQQAGTTGSGLRLEGLEVQLDSKGYDLGIAYRTHVQNKGWQDWSYDGALSGTTGQGLRLEALELSLTGADAATFDLSYRVHCQNKGWLDWVKNGESAGTCGQALRLEALEIKLTKKEISPSRVSNLVAEAASQGVNLSWQAVEGASAYEALISEDGESFAKVSSTIETNSYQVTGLIPGTRYWFKVRAVTPFGTAEDSAPVTAIANVDDQGNTFVGDLLLVSNPSTDITTSQTATNLPADQAVTTESVAQNQPRGIDWIVNPALADGFDFSSLDLTSLETNQSYVLGDTRSFYVYETNSDSQSSITGRCAYDGQHVQVWVDNAEDAAVKLTDDQALAIGDHFDTIIYPLITDNFYPVSDLDGNGKIAILCFDIDKDAALPELPQTFTAGYFDSADLLPEGYFGDYPSNQMEIFYIDTYPSMMENFSEPDVDHPLVNKIYPYLAHEFQHMVNFNRNVLEERDPDWCDPWLNEALSMAAEDLYFEKTGTDNLTRDEMIGGYNNSNAAEIGTGKSLLDWDGSLANYELSYLFSQYLKSRIDQVQGSGQGILSYHDIIVNASNDYRAVEDLIKAKIDPDLTFGQFMTDFRAAMILKAPSGPYGFNGEAGFDGLQTPLYTGSEVNLQGGGAVVIKLKETFKTQPQGQDLAFVGIFEQ